MWSKHSNITATNAGRLIHVGNFTLFLWALRVGQMQFWGIVFSHPLLLVSANIYTEIRAFWNQNLSCYSHIHTLALEQRLQVPKEREKQSIVHITVKTVKQIDHQSWLPPIHESLTNCLKKFCICSHQKWTIRGSKISSYFKACPFCLLLCHSSSLRSGKWQISLGAISALMWGKCRQSKVRIASLVSLSLCFWPRLSGHFHMYLVLFKGIYWFVCLLHSLTDFSAFISVFVLFCF